MGQALNVKLYLITDDQCLKGNEFYLTHQENLLARVTLGQSKRLCRQA